MFNKDLSKYNSIGILGFGKEGKSTYNILRLYFPNSKLHISDINPNFITEEAISLDKNVVFYSGENYLEILNKTDIIFVSPGISLFNIKVPNNIKLTSQTDFIFTNFGNKIVAVTGTKGKSTTVSLIKHILESKFKKVSLAGNIGIPPFDIINEIIENEYTVFEVSSHQLQLIKSAPKVATILNLYPEHLDYYPSKTKYFDSKRRIFKFQKENDCAILNNDDTNIIDNYTQNKNEIINYAIRDHKKTGAFCDGDFAYFRAKSNETIKLFNINNLNIKGLHNLSNCLATASVAMYLGVEPSDISNRIESFKGLPHRLEKVETASKSIFYNDSIATIPEACLGAIESLKFVTTLILGGMDRNLEYNAFINKLISSKVKNICFYDKAGKRMYEIIKDLDYKDKRIFYFDDFESSAKKAISLTGKNEICLLSPAAASYGQFRNFEERGDFFKEIIKIGEREKVKVPKNKEKCHKKI